MPQVHDRGGWPGAGPINQAGHDLSMWEQRTDALLVLLSSPTKQLIRVDELRRAIESLPPDAYEKLSYYERWISAIETLLVEKGVLTKEEIDRKADEGKVTSNE
ncbi:MAG: nitrile hydratase subunit beta [Deltaproteobacteria bacterium]|nr:nitrile hydratase subunit beta [Deltaproteobacteria bacterium]